MVLIIFVIYSIISSFLTYFSLKTATKFNIVDNPNSAPGRKFQKLPVPLLGLVGIVISNILLMSLFWLALKFDWLHLQNFLQNGLFYTFNLFWVLIGGLIIYIAGCLDDKYSMNPRYYFGAIFVGLLVAVKLGGLKIEAFSYPFDSLNLRLGFIPQLLAFVWIGACLTATKFLDGLDGLVTSVGIVSFLGIAAIAVMSNVNQPLIGIFALIWSSSLVGFLWHNFPEAKVYLGDGGSTIIGFMIGSLSILSGAKVATSSTVIGWFILDIGLVMLVRIIRAGRLSAILSGDAKLHWHHRLTQMGFSKLQVLVITGMVITTTSQLGIRINTENKFYILLSVAVVLITIFLISLGLSHKKK